MTWCKDIARDAAVRAAEDGRTGPLPTLGEAIASPFADAAERSVPVSKKGETQSGMRRERITLEVTHDLDARLSDWIVEVVDESLGLMESVRVVDEPSSEADAEMLRRSLVASEMRRLREERRWIPVGERLPEDHRRVVVNVPSLYGPQVAWLVNGKWHDGIGCGDEPIGCRVTHWQPLPPGPEGDG